MIIVSGSSQIVEAVLVAPDSSHVAFSSPVTWSTDNPAIVALAPDPGDPTNTHRQQLTGAGGAAAVNIRATTPGFPAATVFVTVVPAGTVLEIIPV